MTVIESLRSRISAALTIIPSDDEDHRVLAYVGREISPAGIERRAESEWDPGIIHLQEVAEIRLRKYKEDAS